MLLEGRSAPPPVAPQACKPCSVAADCAEREERDQNSSSHGQSLQWLTARELDLVAPAGPRPEKPGTGLDELRQPRALALVERLVHLGQRPERRLAKRLHCGVMPREQLAEEHLVECLRPHGLADTLPGRAAL